MSVTHDRTVTPSDREFPHLLRQIQDPPARLNLRGRLEEGDSRAVAIVGSRNPTPYGLSMARKLAGGLAARGVTVVSGLARGIDTQAHIGALSRGGRTLAVLGCGLDVEYPRGSRDLKDHIARRGAILTEFPRATPPLPHHFPSRNRIISGLSLAVVVVQAGLRSGSLVTARWALDQGREVLAVPGRADEPLSLGPIALIRDGAAVVGNAEEIIETLGLEARTGKISGEPGDPLLQALEGGPRFPEELARATDRSISAVLSGLSRLELEGLILREPGGRFFLR